jgi:prepilin-type N-terminal cleavage/methylation domain-containing protein
MSRDRSGFTLFELLTTIVIVGIVLGMAYPKIMQMSQGISLRSARGALITALNVSKSSAIVSGKCSYLRLASNSVTVFTTACQGGTQIEVVSSRNFGVDYGVTTTLARGAGAAATTDSIGFDPRGIPINNAQTVTFTVTKGANTKDVVVGNYGRIQ